MALEQPNPNPAYDQTAIDPSLDDAYRLLLDAKDRLNAALCGMSDQVQRTLASTAYDIAEQARVLTQQAMLMRGTEPSER